MTKYLQASATSELLYVRTRSPATFYHLLMPRKTELNHGASPQAPKKKRVNTVHSP